MGAPAEGNLHLEGVWPMGLRLGFVASSQLAAGILVGMKTFNFIFRTYPYCLYFFRDTCIFETVTAPVTFTNNWINILPSFSKIRKWLTRIIWRGWPAGPIVTRRPPSWPRYRPTVPTGRYVHYLPLRLLVICIIVLI